MKRARAHRRDAGPAVPADAGPDRVRAGVSPATVSKVLNGRTDVAAATRERVEALLRTHNYPGRAVRAAPAGPA